MTLTALRRARSRAALACPIVGKDNSRQDDSGCSRYRTGPRCASVSAAVNPINAFHVSDEDMMILPVRPARPKHFTARHAADLADAVTREPALLREVAR